MMLEEATFGVFGYWPSELKQQSHKPLLAACDECSKIRVTTKHDFCVLCHSCGIKGERNPNFGKFDKNHPRFNKKHTDKTKAKQSAANKAEKCYNYKGGKQAANARKAAKRKELGFIPINPYFEGCEGHHITHSYVVYIPAYLHKSVWHNLNTSQGMEAINTLALDFLVNGF